MIAPHCTCPASGAHKCEGVTAGRLWQVGTQVTTIDTAVLHTWQQQHQTHLLNYGRVGSGFDSIRLLEASVCRYAPQLRFVQNTRRRCESLDRQGRPDRALQAADGGVAGVLTAVLEDDQQAIVLPDLANDDA